MSKNAVTRRLTTAVVAILLGAALGASLSACGQKEGESEPANPSQNSDAQAQEQAPSDEAPAPSGLTGEPLPADWPAEILVPNGEVILVLEIGAGYSITIEGVDSEQARSLIAEMAAAGLQTMGPADTGIQDDWTASAQSATHHATYSYANGGAGLPNVTMMLTPA